MRKVYRDIETLKYWDKRWAEYDADPECFTNLEIYPIKYAERVVGPDKKILDAGCGLGRIVKHYYNKGYNICGFDYSDVAVQKLKEKSPELDIRWGNIVDMDYPDGVFDVILAFGVYHSIESVSEIRKAMKETGRCLAKGGYLVASARADNVESFLIDCIAQKKGNKGGQFHKLCLKESEFVGMLKETGLSIERSELVTNVPFLYKYTLFRREEKSTENGRRGDGYNLNPSGDMLYKGLKMLFPKAFGTTIVVTARKNF